MRGNICPKLKYLSQACAAICKEDPEYLSQIAYSFSRSKQTLRLLKTKYLCFLIFISNITLDWTSTIGLLKLLSVVKLVSLLRKVSLVKLVSLLKLVNMMKLVRLAKLANPEKLVVNLVNLMKLVNLLNLVKLE